MKFAVSGKGGAGKTTLTALLASELQRRDYRVTVIDADPNPTLAAALGFPPGPLTPLLEMSDEIEERIGGPGGFIRLNPRVDDLVGRVAVAHDGINLIVAGGITHGGAGCACPQAVLLRRLLEHVVTEFDEAVLIDLEAGLEHLGRRSAHEVDAMLVVVDPSRASLETARRIRRLAGEIGVASVLAVGNRIRGPADLDYLADGLDGLELVGSIPFSDDVIQAERAGRPVANLGGTMPEAVARLTDALVATTKVQVSS
ncbi:MAG: AAA family ATPase [Chloroflexota bacterium]|nr:AAA family ATPase [Chloroflexota bacterium]